MYIVLKATRSVSEHWPAGKGACSICVGLHGMMLATADNLIIGKKSGYFFFNSVLIG